MFITRCWQIIRWDIPCKRWCFSGISWK